MSIARLLRITATGLLLCLSAASWGEESLTVVPGRIPYLGETVGHVVVTTAPDRPGASLTLEVTTAAGMVLGAGPVLPEQRSAVEIPLSGLPQGTTVLRCRLLDGKTEVASADVRLTRLAPKPHAVQIDNRRRGLLVDGLPFLPFGFYQQVRGTPEGDPTVPPVQAMQGFNLYSPYSSGLNAAGIEHIRTWMDRCAEVGMKVNYDLRYDCRTGSWDVDLTPEQKDALRAEIEALRDHPALLSWYIADEPPDSALERLAAMRRFVKELDPYHPVTVIIGNHGSQLSDAVMGKWREVTDVAWHDVYPVSSRTENVAGFTANLLTRLDRLFGHSLPVWHTPQCYGWPFGSNREPSAQELRAMTYAGLISGATAIKYFVYVPDLAPQSPRLWAEAGRLAQEVVELTPFLLSEEPRRRATGDGPGVMTAAWQDRGMALVVALNTENAPTSLKVSLSDSTYSGPAEVLFENRQVQVRAGVIEDTIEALGTRVYQIPEGPFPADRAALDPANLRAKPSFEEWVNAGSPTGVGWLTQRGSGSTCFLDARTAVHGRHSLRMTAASSEGIRLAFDEVELRPGGRYRVSIWARADRPGAGLRLGLPQTDRADGTHFTLTTEWQEYSVPVTANADVDTRRYERPKPWVQFDGPGAVWVDLFQIVPAD